MATMKKIYELAKEIGQKPQDIIRFLNSSGFPGFKSELNPINSIVADFVYEKFTGKPAPKKEEKKIVRPPAAKPEVVVSAPVKPAVPLIKKEAPSTQEKPVLKKKETEEQTVDSGTPKTSLKTPVKVGSHKVAPAVVQAKAGAGKPKQQELAPAQKLADALAKKAVPKQVQPAATTGKKPEPVRVGRHGHKQAPRVPVKQVLKPLPKEEKPEGELAAKEKVQMTEVTTVAELAVKLKVSGSDLIKKIMSMGMMVTLNAKLDKDSIALIAAEFNFEVEIVSIFTEEALPEEIEEEKNLVFEDRPPIVTVMGHVDHGKTSLLDAIRETNVAGGEAGQITQHIGAYKVVFPKGDIVFLDTPGHEAFTSMRARGAQVTDIVVLVVAADDGVMPQTIEAINHAKAAKVPIIVAMNKMDKPEANPEKVKQELSKYELISEEWGGKTVFVPVSARKRTGVEQLLEMILLECEMLELKASKQGNAKGVIIEARLDKGKGPVATVMVEQGTLHVGDSFVSGFQYGKVRAMMSDRGERLKDAVPPTPVEITGFSGVPSAGDVFQVVSDEKKARAIALRRNELQRDINIQKSKHITLENIYNEIQEGKLKELNIILKGDVAGSIDAISEALEKLSTEKIKVQIIHKGTGNISESDVMLAAASNAVIMGFSITMNTNVPELAKQENVDIKLFKIIYEIIDAVKLGMEGLLEPVFQEVITGRAEVKQMIKIPDGFIAGCMVTEGKINRSGKMRVKRAGEVLGEGKISSLRRFKDDVKEVLTGYECGIGIEGMPEMQAGDLMEVVTQEKILRKLGDNK